MALAALLTGAASCDRGAASPPLVFDPPVRVNDGSGAFAQAEPAIAVSASGTVLVSWIDWTPPRPLVRVTVSTNGGASFAPSIAVEDPASEHSDGQADPTLALREGGRARIAWLACGRDERGLGGRRCDVRTRASEDGGRTWSAPSGVTASVLYRERPWVLADGDDLLLTWSEARESGRWRWLVARESAGFDPSRVVEDRSTVLRPSLAGEGRLHALLVDRTNRDPLSIVLERVEDGDVKETFRVPKPAVLLDYSYGAIAADGTGASWTALAMGDGLDGDLRLRHGTRDAGRARSVGASRVGFPWLEPVGGGRFVLAWIEEHADGWRVKARLLGPGARVGAVAEVGRVPFRFAAASLDVNVGDYLQAAAAGDSVWVAWSDTRTGTADVYIARARLPRR